MNPTTIGFLLPGAIAPLLIMCAAIAGIAGFSRHAAFLLVAAFSSLVLAPITNAFIASLPAPLHALAMPGGLAIAGLILSWLSGRRWRRLPGSTGTGLMGRGLANVVQTRIGRILILAVVLWVSFWFVISSPQR